MRPLTNNFVSGFTHRIITMKNIITIILLSLTFTLTAQVKSISVGLRGGGVSGFSYKYIDHDFKAFEIIAGWQEGGFRMVGLIQKYKPIATNHIANLFVFIGGGAHAGYVGYTQEYVYHGPDGYDYYYPQEKAKSIFGGDIIVGTEYRFESIPLRLGVDYKPYFQLFGEEDFRVDLWDIGFTIRYEI